MFKCDNTYLEELQQLSVAVTAKYGMTSEACDREIMYLAKEGNKAAKKAYADLIFYRKIEVLKCYEKAFSLYLQAADIEIEEKEGLVCKNSGVPQAFAMLGYYFYNYKRDGHLKSCEVIPQIDTLIGEDAAKRIRYSLALSASCLIYEKVPAAINLLGRILDEVSQSEELFEALKEDLNSSIFDAQFSELPRLEAKITSLEDCAAAGAFFYNEAAKCGYVYACNNLASREADKICELTGCEIDGGKSENEAVREPSCEVKKHIENYVSYLKMSAEKFEPYAANRLGLFYISGEIRSARLDKKYNFRGYCDSATAKKYFVTATMYPNKNSAWAYYNLLKHYPKDYNMNIDLMNEHMDCIKRLDPKVYDLAIEE